MSESTSIQWKDYPEVERFIAGVQALCNEAMKTAEVARDPSGHLEISATIPISFRVIAEVMLLHDALPESLRCVSWCGENGDDT